MNEAVYHCEFNDPDRNCLLKVEFSEDEAWCVNCDATIDYSIFDPDTREYQDGGQMDYESARMDYGDNITNALNDIIDFAFAPYLPHTVTATDIDPDSLTE